MPTIRSIIGKELQQRLYLYSLLFFAALLPFQPKWLPLTLGIMFYGLFWLLSLDFKTKFKLLSGNSVAAVMFAYILWIVIGGFYSDEPSEAGKDIISKIPFLVWPLLMGSTDFFNRKHVRYITGLFIIATLLSVLYCFTTATLSYLGNGSLKEFHFINLVDYPLISPHYLGMYITFSFALVLSNLLRGYNYFSRSADIVMLLIFFIAIVLIAVRMQYLVFVVLNIWIIFSYCRGRYGVGPALLSSLALLTLLSILVWSFPGSRNRVKDTYNEIISFEETVNHKQTNHRKFLWIATAEVISEDWLLGKGTGAANNVINQKLLDDDHAFWDGTKVYYLRDRYYNAHNSYLQHWATNGIIGLLLLLALFLIAWRKADSTDKKIFLLVCAMSFITESMLERQAGVLFFSFFFSLFFVLPAQKTGKQDERTKKGNRPMPYQ